MTKPELKGSPFEPIAIVGQSCVLPGALNPAELWDAVAAGRDLTSAAPAGRWGLSRQLALAQGGERTRDQAWNDRGGYVRGFEDLFDPEGFAVPAGDIQRLDALFQWVLHAGREALSPLALSEDTARRTGVVLGNLSFPTLGSSRFAEAVWRGEGMDEVDPKNHFMSGLPAHLLARGVGLGGPCFALDSACASSLVAIKLACDYLHDRRADTMLAGAVSCADDLFIHIGFSALEALSPSGQSRPFHRDADGLLPAEGVALVALRRLSDAVEQGDEILGVIRGVGLSNDGRSGGLLAPSEEGQIRAIRRAYEVSGLEPSDISLVECHATGTHLGDGAEIRSLDKLYHGLNEVPIGSLKSNLGHLITAAGTAGLLKVLAAMKAGLRPPTLHADEPNPTLADSPFRLLHEAEPWTCDGPRRAAISAFGFGGNNAHLLVEQWQEQSRETLLGGSGEPKTNDDPVAIVALAATAASATQTSDFVRVLFSGETALTDRDGSPAGLMQDIDLPLAGLGFPPKDLEQTLPQQLALLGATRRALDGLESELPKARTGVLIGMRCDAEIARYGLRWRMAERIDGAELSSAQDAIVNELQAAGVVGTMPNMTANRLNSQLDLGGASASISSEELSGLRVCDLAARALRGGELDAVLVGSADLACEPVHEAAVEALIGKRIPGDAATVMVLKRLDDAQRDGDRVLAVLDGRLEESGEGVGLRLHHADDSAASNWLSLEPQVGHAHAAAGLIHVAAAALCCYHRAVPAALHATGRAMPWLAPSQAEVAFQGLQGGSASLSVRCSRTDRGHLPPAGGLPSIELYCGADRSEVLSRLEEGQATSPSEVSAADPARLALISTSETSLAEQREAARQLLSQDSGTASGIFYRSAPLRGELAFVYAGAGGAYHGMGRELVLARPDLLDRLSHRLQDLPAVAGWVYDSVPQSPLTPLQQLWGASFLCQAQTELTRGILGLQPAAALGFSSGESNSLMAMGAWNDLDALHRDTVECGIFTQQLGGPFAAIRRAWNVADEAEDVWANWVLQASPDAVRQAIAGEERVHLTLISSPGDVAIGGEPEACRRVIARLGVTAVPLGYDLAVHCPEVGEVAGPWLELHRRETRPVPGVRFYSHSTNTHYRPTRETAAQAILGQAVRTLDFPKLIQQAWDDGVRVFLEHGPRGLCSSWIRKTLEARDIAPDQYLAVPLDRRGDGSLHQTATAVAELLVAGVDVRWDLFHAPDTAQARPSLTFAAHWPAIPHFSKPEPAAQSEPAMPQSKIPSEAPAAVQTMPAAPTLPPVLEDFSPTAPANGNGASFEERVPTVATPLTPAVTSALDAALTRETPLPPISAVLSSPEPASGVGLEVAAPVASPVTVPSDVLSRMSALQAKLASAQQQYVSTQTALHERFLSLRQQSLDGLIAAYSGAATQPNSPVFFEAPAAPPEPQLPVIEPEIVEPEAVDLDVLEAEVTDAAAEPISKPPATPEPLVEPPAVSEDLLPSVEDVVASSSDLLPGPKWSRQDLEHLASGNISEIFGSLFEGQDQYPRQTRMPEPPFLLADRVTGIDAEPRSMGTGTIWTETDVSTDSWYLFRGHMPGGLMIEAGQADLLLISWLGIDFLNRNERVYRLLGCELTYRRGLPKPGETLSYEIHVDGHAQQGDVRLFFFHYDCQINGEVCLEVRHGQAGFFTNEELANSAGVLWDPKEEGAVGEHLDSPRALTQHRSFSNEQLVAFSEGRVLDCMGPGFELAAAHTLTPSIQSGRMLLLDTVDELDPKGGPWQRGYLRASFPIHADSWIFEGHFKNDPCMPGTLMLEGCFQAMAFYLAALGFTIDRDGWRFEPVPDETYTMRCRGQAIPTSKELVYELFVHEIIDGPQPTLHADLLCTVDGLKAFHARRLGLRLAPDWPLEVQPEMALQPFPGGTRPTGRPVAEVDGFAFDYDSLLACAWGRPTKAFGPMYKPFDSHRKVARLPGPPYHFMSRIASIDGEMGNFTPGADLVAEYDVPPEEWYFADNGYPTMPFAVLLEAGLQPCGWLASYIGSALTTDIDLQFRNLDGTGTLLAEVDPRSGIVSSRVRLTATSSSAGVLIVRFEVTMKDNHRDIYKMDTAFGFFPAAAMENQVGLPANEQEQAWLERPSDLLVDLTDRGTRYFKGSLRLADKGLMVLDRVNGYWPEAGEAGLGRLRAEKDVDPSEWFFKAHFYSDPVQPGSLGIEAMVQLLQFYMLEADLGKDMKNPRFESLATNLPLTWKYRGQVLPTNGVITTEIEITEVGKDDRGVYALATSYLWVDGKRIYSAHNLGMRIVEAEDPDLTTPRASSDDSQPAPAEGPKPATPEAGEEVTAEPAQADASPEVVRDGEEVLDPQHDTWIADHCPTYTLPALPMMSMVERLAAAAAEHWPDLRIVGLEDVQVERWIAFEGPRRLRTEILSEERRGSEMGAVEVRLSVWRDAAKSELSRFETAATGTVLMARGYCSAPPALPALAEPLPEADPYATGELFHGPAFHLLTHLAASQQGSSSLLDAAADSVPHGVLNQALLDAATHGIPHDALDTWSAEIPEGLVAYPRRISEARFYSPTPESGPVRCEARFERFDPETQLAVFHLQLIHNDETWADLRLHEVLLPKGPLGSAPADQRRAFLRDKAAIAGLALSRLDDDGRTRLHETAVATSDWLPGTVRRIYGVDSADAPLSRDRLAQQVAVKDHLARQTEVHPSTIDVELGSVPGVASGVARRFPLTRYPVYVEEVDGATVVADAAVPTTDLTMLRSFWSDYLEIENWPVEDIYYGLIERFMRRVVVTDPDGLAAIHGRSTLFLANHQVGVESLLFSIVSSALIGAPTVTLAKAEHQVSWLGRLIAHCFSYPGVKDPEVIAFFKRENMRSLPLIIRKLGKRMRNEPRSVAVHCEGTRSLTCRKPVEALSGSFIDMAMKADAAIVPVRFTGGLPAEPLEKRIEFPLGHGQQDYWLGSPLLPEQLAELRYKDRRQAVIAAINGLGPSNEVEEPLPGNPEFAVEVEDWVHSTGASPEHATIFKMLSRLDEPTDDVRRLVEAAAAGRLETTDDPQDVWLAEMARRLFGELGPRVE